jgi:hypothetical protein
MPWRLQNHREVKHKIVKKIFYSLPQILAFKVKHNAYYGYKIHAVCSLVEGVSKASFDISKASVHDIHYFKDIKVNLIIALFCKKIIHGSLLVINNFS